MGDPTSGAAGRYSEVVHVQGDSSLPSGSSTRSFDHIHEQQPQFCGGQARAGCDALRAPEDVGKRPVDSDRPPHSVSQ